MTKVKKILLAGAAIWFLALLVIVVPEMAKASRERAHFEKNVHEFVSAIQTGNLEKAYAVGGEEFKKATPFAEFKRQREELLSRNGSLKAFRIDSYEVTIRKEPADWRATAIVVLEFERKRELFRFLFHNESGRWVLFGYRPE